MANQVFANMMEVSCKAAAGKAIAAMPDVCFTPPQTPATPPGVPIPYPNTGMASDTSDGTRTVKITDQEVMLKNKSYFKQSTGDEAGCAPKKGVITSQNKGKVYFNAWSMDVKFEGENVVRHLDLTTHNHGSVPGNTPTWPYLDKMDVANNSGKCAAEIKKEKDACDGCKPNGDKDPCPDVSALDKAKSARAATKKDTPERKAASDVVKNEYEALATKVKSDEHKCLQARRCQLVPYKPKGRGKDRQPGCCPGQTGHHLIEAATFLADRENNVLRPEHAGAKYDVDQAPCVCAEGPDNTTATHGLMHTYQGVRAQKISKDGKWTLNQAAETGAASNKMVFGDSECSEECIKAQIMAYHDKEHTGVEPGDKVEAASCGTTKGAKADKASADWAAYDKVRAGAKGSARGGGAR